MNAVQVAAFCYVTMKYLKQRKRRRRYWVHPINDERYIHGHFYTVYPRLRKDPDKFFEHFRMSPATFDELLNILKKYIKNKDTLMRTAIPAEEKLALTLTYLSTGCSLKEVHLQYRIGKSTACQIIPAVCRQIWRVMKSKCIPKPNELDWEAIAEGFSNRADFPNCVGAIGGKHIRVVKPAGIACAKTKFKDYASVVLLAAVNTDYYFTYVDVDSFTRNSDPPIFSNCSLWKEIENKTVTLPWSPLTGATVPLPFAFAGDKSIGLSTHLLHCYSGKQLAEYKKVFNYRLSRARRYLDCTFAILSNKWRILQEPIDVSLNLAVDIVKCCCVLHNFVCKRDGYRFEDTLTIVGHEDYHFASNIKITPSLSRIRDSLAKYFMSDEGQLTGQLDRIKK